MAPPGGGHMVAVAYLTQGGESGEMGIRGPVHVLLLLLPRGSVVAFEATAAVLAGLFYHTVFPRLAAWKKSCGLSTVGAWWRCRHLFAALDSQRVDVLLHSNAGLRPRHCGFL